MLVMVPVGPVVPAMGLLPRTRPRTRPLRMRMPAGPVVLVVGLLLRMRMRGRLPRMRAPRRRRSMRMPVVVMSVVLGLRMPMPALVGLVMVVVRGLVRLLRVMRMVRRRRFVRMLVAVMVVVLGFRMPMLPPMEPVMPVGVGAVRLLMRLAGLMVGVRRRLMRLVLLWLVRLGWVWRGLVLLMLLVVERMPAGWVARPRIRIPVGLMVRGPDPTRARMALVAATRLDGPATTAAPRATSRRTPVPRARGPMSPGLRMRLRRTTRLILVLLVIPMLPLMSTGTDLTMTRCTTTITETVETMTIPILTSRVPVTAVRLTMTRPFPSCSKTAPATWRHVTTRKQGLMRICPKAAPGATSTPPTGKTLSRAWKMTLIRTSSKSSRERLKMRPGRGIMLIRRRRVLVRSVENSTWMSIRIMRLLVRSSARGRGRRRRGVGRMVRLSRSMGRSSIFPSSRVVMRISPGGR